MNIIHFFAKFNIMNAQEILNRFSDNSQHPLAVKNLALIIFNETSLKVHELKDNYKKYLETAALLHDIGYHIDSKNHNKHSMKMVLEHGLDGFDAQETKIIACICRYHRGSLPDKNEHDIYNTFDKKERKIVKRLAGILKIADGLDSRINNITINYDSDNNIAEFILTPNVREFLPDITNTIRKRDLYEIAFKCQVVFKFNT